MTVCAFELWDLEGRDLAIVGHFVALTAFHLDVLPHERELGEVVIEAAGEPILGYVAPRAIGDPLLHEIIPVHIVMAIRAGAADVPEGPVLPILHVACETRCGLVRTIKWERRLLVLFDAEHAHLETIREEVAFHTIRRNTVLGEHALVEVLVTTVAGVEHDGVCVRPLVALLAINSHVFPLQRVVREIVIEVDHGAQSCEALLLVALGAVGPELPFVRILVAGGALVLQHTVPILEHRQWVTGLLVAFEAVRRFVLTEQPEMRCAVIEAILPDERSEGLLRVALGTGIGEVGLVRIRMASPAIGMRHIGEFLELLPTSRGHLVAFKTGHLNVSTPQWEFRLGVIELLGWLEGRHVVAAQAILR